MHPFLACTLSGPSVHCPPPHFSPWVQRCHQGPLGCTADPEGSCCLREEVLCGCRRRQCLCPLDPRFSRNPPGEVTSAQTLILPCPWGSCELPTPASVAVGWFLDPTSVLGMLFWSSLCPSGCGLRSYPSLMPTQPCSFPHGR